MEGNDERKGQFHFIVNKCQQTTEHTACVCVYVCERHQPVSSLLLPVLPPCNIDAEPDPERNLSSFNAKRLPPQSPPVITILYCNYSSLFNYLDPPDLKAAIVAADSAGNVSWRGRIFNETVQR